jgi:hypothetical protein
MPSYAKFKDFHLWAGLVLLIPMSVIAATGLLWNHEKTLGLKQDYQKPHKGQTDHAHTQPLLVSTPAVVREQQHSLEAALAASEKLWGKDTEIEKIELRNEPGLGLIVKVKLPERATAIPNEIFWSVAEQRIVARKGDPADGFDTAKLIHDLHTGMFFSDRFGFVWSDSGALAILFLGGTGLILYVLPGMKKRANRRRREAQTEAAMSLDVKSSKRPVSFRKSPVSDADLELTEAAARE